MRNTRALSHIVVAGCTLGAAAAANADVVLLSQQRSVTAVAATTRSSSAPDFADWSANRMFYQSGVNGYWNGAAQYSSFQPDGATGLGQSVYAEGSARSDVFGSTTRASTWTANSTFKFSFRADTAHLINIFTSTSAAGSGAVVASLKQGGTTIWTLSGNGNENVEFSLGTGLYDFELVSSSSLDTAGNGGDSSYTLGIGFTTVPGPSGMAMIALNAFIRRRRA